MVGLRGTTIYRRAKILVGLWTKNADMPRAHGIPPLPTRLVYEVGYTSIGNFTLATNAPSGARHAVDLEYPRAGDSFIRDHGALKRLAGLRPRLSQSFLLLASLALLSPLRVRQHVGRQGAYDHRGLLDLDRPRPSLRRGSTVRPSRGASQVVQRRLLDHPVHCTLLTLSCCGIDIHSTLEDRLG